MQILYLFREELKLMHHPWEKDLFVYCILMMPKMPVDFICTVIHFSYVVMQNLDY